MKIKRVFSTFILLQLFTHLGAQGNMVINELQVWPVNDSYGEAFSEFIEITNTGTETADLEGWTIQTNSGSAVITGVTVDPDGFAILAIY